MFAPPRSFSQLTTTFFAGQLLRHPPWTLVRLTIFSLYPHPASAALASNPRCGCLVSETQNSCRPPSGRHASVACHVLRRLLRNLPQEIPIAPMAWSCTSPVRQSANNSTLDVSPSSVKLPAIARGDCHPSPSLYRVKDPKTIPTPVSRVSQQFNSTTGPSSPSYRPSLSTKTPRSGASTTTACYGPRCQRHQSPVNPARG